MARTRSLALVPLLAILLNAQSSNDGLQLFHKMRNAYGGAARIAAVRDFEQYKRAETWNVDGTVRGVVRKRVRFIRRSYLRIDQAGPGDTYVLYFDGTSGWESLPNGKFQKLAGGELQFAQGYLGGLQLNSLLRDRAPDVIFASSKPNIITIAIRGDDKHKDEIILDPKTFLPLESRGISLADPDHPWQAPMNCMAGKRSRELNSPERSSIIMPAKSLLTSRWWKPGSTAASNPPTSHLNRRISNPRCRVDRLFRIRSALKGNSWRVLPKMCTLYLSLVSYYLHGRGKHIRHRKQG